MTAVADLAPSVSDAPDTLDTSTSSRPLSGVRVVECAVYIAAPSGGTALARLGADVIRIDPIGGAPDRGRWPVAPSGQSLYWAGLNQGKRSVVIDLRSEQGREIATELAIAPGPDAGILLHNRARRAWLDDESLRRRRPDLVHIVVEGLRDGTPALDYTVNARVGVPYLTGQADGAGVVNHVLPAWDLLAGATASTALLAALRRRDRTGLGALARISLEDVAIAAMADLGWLADAQLSGTDRARHGNQLFGTYGDVLTTLDGQPVMVIAMTERQWRALQSATGTTDAFASLADTLHLDLDSEEGRYEHRALISAVLARWFAEHALDETLEALTRAGALHAAYGSLTQLARELARPGADSVVDMVSHPGIGTVLTASSPVRLADVEISATSAPRLGQHTAEVLATVLGLSQAEIGRLLDDGVVAGDAS